MTIYAERYALAELSAHGTVMEPERAVRIACDVLRTLADDYHSLGQVHGAVTPASVMVNSDGSASLLDPLNFDLDFIAPEIIEGSDLRAGADVYAVAALLTDLLVGQVARPISLVRVDAALRPVLGMALIASPAWRYSTASEFLFKLEHAADEAFGPQWRNDRAGRASALAS
ncbi:MAG: hypothetical protein ACSLEW_03820 [Nocardioides sp.]